MIEQPGPSAIYLGWRDSPTSDAVEARLRGRVALVQNVAAGFDTPVDQASLAALEADLLFSFGPTLVRGPLLRSLRLGAINFHTAPPKWPGRGSCSFALFEGDSTFGVTAHLMDEKIDAGPILRVVRFPVLATDTVESLHRRTLEHIPNLVDLVLADLRQNNWVPVPVAERWERSALRSRDLQELMRINDSDSPEIVARRIRALAHPTKPGPYIERYGHRFWYVADPHATET